MGAHEQLQKMNVSLGVITAGSGSALLDKLWGKPGASSFLSSFHMPYSQASTYELLGFQPEKIVAAKTAMDLAMQAYMNAYTMGGKEPVGLGIESALSTTKEKRGSIESFICVIKKDHARMVHYQVLNKEVGEVSRKKQDEEVAEEAMMMLTEDLGTIVDNQVLERFFERPVIDSDGTRLEKVSGKAYAVFPGSFNPPHQTHDEIAAEVRRKQGIDKVWYTINQDHPYKGHLSLQDLLKRAKLMKGRPVVFTRGAPLYEDKLKAFPEKPIVIGGDALLAMLDPKWGPQTKPMLIRFSQAGARFYVSPRIVDGVKLGVGECFDRAGHSDHVFCNFYDMFEELLTSSDVSSTFIRSVLENPS